MSKYTAEQVEAFIREQENHAFVREDLDLEATMDYLRDYASHLREREAAMTAVTEELAIEAGKAIAARFSEGFFDQRMVVECGRAALEAVVPMLASARVPDGYWRRLAERHSQHMINRREAMERGDYATAQFYEGCAQMIVQLFEENAETIGCTSPREYLRSTAPMLASAMVPDEIFAALRNVFHADGI